MQAARTEHFHRRLTLAEGMSGFEAGEPAEEAKRDHFGAIGVEVLQGAEDLLQLQALNRGSISGHAGVGKIGARW